MEQKEAYDQGRRQALLDAVILVRKYFTDEMNALPVNEDDEILDMPTCNKILKYNKDICTELRKMVPQEVIDSITVNHHTHEPNGSPCG